MKWNTRGGGGWGVVNKNQWSSCFIILTENIVRCSMEFFKLNCYAIKFENQMRPIQ